MKFRQVATCVCLLAVPIAGCSSGAFHIASTSGPTTAASAVATAHLQSVLRSVIDQEETEYADAGAYVPAHTDGTRFVLTGTSSTETVDLAPGELVTVNLRPGRDAFCLVGVLVSDPDHPLWYSSKNGGPPRHSTPPGWCKVASSGM